MMQQITVSQLRQKLRENNELFLLDVREPFEHEDFNIGGKLIPMDEIMSKAAEIPTDQPVIVYCRKGLRSQIVIQRLEDKFGFSNLVNLEGGLEKW